MAFTQVFFGFLQFVALGSATVLALFLVIGIKTPRRSPVLANRKPSR